MNVRAEEQAVGVLQSVVLALAAVAAEEMPPEAPAYLALKGREAEAGSVAVEAESLCYADGEALECPEPLSAVLNAEDRLKRVKVRPH